MCEDRDGNVYVSEYEMLRAKSLEKRECVKKKRMKRGMEGSIDSSIAR